jgi:7-cyano-7-deazaguanine synthase
MTERAVVLLSGGLDSTTVLHHASKEKKYECYAISFRYGQKNADAELERARSSGALLCLGHFVVDVALPSIARSALTRANIPVPHDRKPEEMKQGVPSTYVPARNTIFLSLALALAESLDAKVILAGMNAVDYSGYPDCRPEFLAAFETLSRMGTANGGVRIEAPLLRLSKAEIVLMGVALGVNHAQTMSCYEPVLRMAGRTYHACGRCDACILRRKGFEEAGLVDPLPYANDPPKLADDGESPTDLWPADLLTRSS